MSVNISTINRTHNRNQELLVILGQLNTTISSSEAAHPILDQQTSISKCLHMVLNHLLFKEKIFYPNIIKKEFKNHNKNHFVIFNFIQELSPTRELIENYLNQWSNFYKIRTNHDKCFFDTQLALRSLLSFTQHEVDCIYPLLNQEIKLNSAQRSHLSVTYIEPVLHLKAG